MTARFPRPAGKAAKAANAAREASKKTIERLAILARGQCRQGHVPWLSYHVSLLTEQVTHG